MNSVSVPVQLVVILRRLANAISSLSISNQYFLLKRERADFEAVGENPESSAAIEDETQGNTAGKPTLSSWETFCALREVEWPSWIKDWPHFMMTPRGVVVESPNLKKLQDVIPLSCAFLPVFKKIISK